MVSLVSFQWFGYVVSGFYYMPKTNTEIWYCNYCKIILTNGDVKLIDKNKIQRLLIYNFLSGVHLRKLKNKEKV